MRHGLRVRNAEGAITFDSTSDKVLHFSSEHYISGIGFSNTTFTYPQHTGKKIVAMMTSPYQTGDIDSCSVLSCRVTYPSGVPTVSIFVDNRTAGLPVCDGYLIVFYTGTNL